MRSFEDDPTLSDLLTEAQISKLSALTGELVNGQVTLAANAIPDAEEIEFNLEPVAWLTCNNDPTKAKAAARLVEFVLTFVGKYRLAANLHNDATEASFEELRRQNEALQESERKYKELSSQLQERVEHQVTQIERAQQHLYESARLRAVGHLAAGVAHEINNPIGFITSNLRVAQDYVSEIKAKCSNISLDEVMLRDFEDLLAESLSGAQRIASIVNDLKIFSNIDQADYAEASLNDLLNSTCQLVKAEAPKEVLIELRLGKLPKIKGYPAKLAQLFYNVLDNAVKSQGGKGIISVSTRAIPNEGVEVVVVDSGCGIPEESLPYVFNPFFTSRPVGSGTGLGLTVAREVVLAHNGKINISSLVGSGTTVRIVFEIKSKNQ